MTKVLTFTYKGVKTGEETLPKEFSQKGNLPLLAQAVHIYEERGHIGLRKTQTRAEVNRTTKKIYKQKGTGGARHGSRRANLYVGGGVALGPRPVRRILTLPVMLKNQAKFLAFSLKATDNEMVLVSDLIKIEKTKSALELIKVLEKEAGLKKFTFVLSDESKAVMRSLRNLQQVKAVLYKSASAYDIFTGGLMVMDQEIFKTSKANKVNESVKAVKTVKKVIAKAK